MKTKEWAPPTAAEITKFWHDCLDDMIDVRRNMLLNSEFFMGSQWISWSDSNASVNAIEFENQADADYRVTVNKIKPRTLSLLARLTRTPLAFEPRPHGIDQEHQRKANTERQVLEVEAHRADWEQVRADLVLNALLGAVAAVAVEPDWEYEAEEVSLIDTGETVRLPKRPAVRLTALSALEFGLEPGTRKQSDARRWVRCTTLTPEQAQERYGLEEPPTPDADASTSSVMHRTLVNRRSGGGLKPGARAVQVLTYYERPSTRGHGCISHVIGDKVVQYAKWSDAFAFTDRLNVVTFVQTPIGSSWKGETILNDARQLQRIYNKAFTSINRHIGKADNARLMLPAGAILDDDVEFTGDVAEVVRYDPQQGMPQWMQAPQVPRWIREHIEKIEMEMDDLFSTHAVSRGQAPGDRNSGLALSILAEKDETPLGPMATNQQRGWQVVAEMTLGTMRHLMSRVDVAREQMGMGPMEVTDVHMRDDQTAEEVTWTAADLPAKPVVHVPLESVMPRSQAAIQEAMVRLVQAFPQMFEGMSPAQLAAIMRTPDSTAFASIRDPQTALATWENTRMIVGVGDDEVIVEDWHDHQLHIDKHNEMRASHSYRIAALETQGFLDTHIAAHKKLQQDMAMQAMAQQQAMQAPPMPGPEQMPLDGMAPA